MEHRKIYQNFTRDELLSVCKFKWSFNAKPDMVIQTSFGNNICIEMKLESAEGAYPQKSKEKDIFTSRGLCQVTQTELQRYLMNTLLGMETKFVFISQRPSESMSGSITFISWRQIFSKLDRTSLPQFMQTIIEKAC